MQGENIHTARFQMSGSGWVGRLGLFILPALLLLAWGCRSEQASRPSTAAERSERALQDPFNYSPFEKEKSPVSGGGISELDREGLKKDTNNVFNP